MLRVTACSSDFGSAHPVAAVDVEGLGYHVVAVARGQEHRGPGVISSSGAMSNTAALFTRMSIPPARPITASTMRSIESCLELNPVKKCKPQGLEGL
jgi:hypothetical protein